MKKLTFIEFSEKSNIIHNNRYDYIKGNYINSKTKIRIICSIHGEFWQTPNNHMKGSGCPDCSNNRTTLIRFIKKSNLIHNNKYDYSETNYKNAKIKVCIVCPYHGKFWQTPDSHIRGTNCPICGEIIRRQSKKLSTDIFMKKANKIHNKKYDYSNSRYKETHTKVCIICPKHGEFWQTPNNHLCGKGCPKCRMSKGEIIIDNYLNTHNISYINQYRFVNCRNKRPLPFDFYLPDYNICIEYDHKQHFEPVEFFGGIESFKYRKHNDYIKTKYCKENNIRLIRIHYNEDIQTALNERII